jgi:hypothetical protein
MQIARQISGTIIRRSRSGILMMSMNDWRVSKVAWRMGLIGEIEANGR